MPCVGGGNGVVCGGGSYSLVLVTFFKRLYTKERTRYIERGRIYIYCIGRIFMLSSMPPVPLDVGYRANRVARKRFEPAFSWFPRSFDTNNICRASLLVTWYTSVQYGRRILVHLDMFAAWDRTIENEN